MVFHHYSDLVKLLIEHGADVNIIGGSNQWTPLFYAAQSGHVTAVELLLHTGADAQVGGATVCIAIYTYMLRYALLYIPICSGGWGYGMHCYIYLYAQVGGTTVCIAIYTYMLRWVGLLYALLYVTGPAKINHVSANYTELYYRQYL